MTKVPMTAEYARQHADHCERRGLSDMSRIDLAVLVECVRWLTDPDVCRCKYKALHETAERDLAAAHEEIQGALDALPEALLAGEPWGKNGVTLWTLIEKLKEQHSASKDPVREDSDPEPPAAPRAVSGRT